MHKMYKVKIVDIYTNSDDYLGIIAKKFYV